MSNWEYQPTVKKAAATRTINVNFEDQLARDETLSGTPTVVEQITSALTITGPTVSTLDVIMQGRTVEASHGVQFTVAGGVARTDYTIRITVDTSLGQILVKDMRLKVI